ncbi:hypothetical protein HAX54_007690 [Datura stramonium]|uniref:Uncharacterized protein n=1 Tax=Datura stramonium TaxID=4076 RepID=A0ABS8WUT6_DATST|nr:hypothetical protein [Datura stramonium]
MLNKNDLSLRQQIGRLRDGRPGAAVGEAISPSIYSSKQEWRAAFLIIQIDSSAHIKRLFINLKLIGSPLTLASHLTRYFVNFSVPLVSITWSELRPAKYSCPYPFGRAQPPER